MIADAIKDAFNSASQAIWGNVVYYLTFQFADPMWFWLLCLGGFIIAVWAFCWFFGSYWPVLRVVGGFAIITAIVSFFTYVIGAKEAREHDAKKKKRRGR